MSINFNQLYYLDPYQTEFTACVVDCRSGPQDCYGVILDQTCFYPEGGGQPGDRGFLTVVGDLTEDDKKLTVWDTQEENGVIFHLVEQALVPGTKVHGKIDFDRRFELMQQHSGEHLISGLVRRDYGLDNVGFHLNEDIMTLDFNGELSAGQLTQIEQDANQAIWRNLPIEIRYPDAAEQASWDYRSKIELKDQVRVVVIEDYDACACCGTQVRTTGEIGVIKIINRERYKGGVRLTAICGSRAYRDYAAKHRAISEAGQLLSARANEIVKRIGQLQLKIDELHTEIRAKNRQWLELYLTTLPNPCPVAVLLNQQFEKRDLKYAVERLASVCTRYAAILTPLEQEEGQGARYLLFLASDSENLRSKADYLKTELEFRGGGNERLLQGPVRGTYEQIERILRKLPETADRQA